MDGEMLDGGKRRGSRVDEVKGQEEERRGVGLGMKRMLSGLAKR